MWGRRFRGDSAFAWAPAKLNLFLEVTGRRDDGYHDIESLILAVDLFDLLEIVRLDEPVFGLKCSDPTLATDASNLIVRAALAMAARHETLWGAMVRVTKRIPREAGLGGGSSDAAATLQALNELWEIRASQESLAEVAATIGSDVAFFLSPPAAWCRGRGEIVEPAPVGEPLDFVIVKPPVGCPTAEVYGRLEVPKSPRSGDAIRKALRRGNVAEIGRAMFNRLEEPAQRVAPNIAEVLNCLKSESPAGVQMTGSGSACFALCRDRREALRIAESVRAARPAGVEPQSVFVVRSWPVSS